MTIDLTIGGNTIAGNLDADHLISFTRNSAAIRPNTLDPAQCPGEGTPCPTSWKSPTNDLFDGGALRNQLRYNGAEVPATVGPNCLFPRFAAPPFPEAQPLVLPGCVTP